MPIPTPAAAAMWRTGASTPETTNTAAAASSRAFSLRRASARFRGADDPDPLSMLATAPLPPSLRLTSGTTFRMLLNGTRIRLFRMPEQTSQSQPLTAHARIRLAGRGIPHSRVRDSPGYAAGTDIDGRRRKDQRPHGAHDRTAVWDHDGPISGHLSRRPAGMARGGHDPADRARVAVRSPHAYRRRPQRADLRRLDTALSPRRANRTTAPRAAGDPATASDRRRCWPRSPQPSTLSPAGGSNSASA